MGYTSFFLSDSAIRDIDISGISGKLSMGVQVLVLGLLTVFSVLAILWLSLVLFKALFYDLPKRRKQNTQPATPSDVADNLPDDGEIVAAITAAIAAAEQEQPTARFRAVSFRRIH